MRLLDVKLSDCKRSYASTPARPSEAMSISPSPERLRARALEASVDSGSSISAMDTSSMPPSPVKLQPAPKSALATSNKENVTPQVQERRVAVRRQLIAVPGSQSTERSAVAVENVPLTLHGVHSRERSFKLPGKFWGVHTDNEQRTAFTKLEPQRLFVEKVLLFTDSLTPKLFVNKTEINGKELKTEQDLLSELKRLQFIRACVGVTDIECRKREWTDGCLGHLPENASNKTIRCAKCVIVRRSKKKQEERKTMGDRLKEMRAKVKVHTQAAARLAKKVDTLKAEVRDTMKDLLKVKQKRVEEILSLLPEEQRPLVQACFDAARHENKKK
ncbi:Coiled-coil and C2 domain-containing protein 1B [Frankliniella fusca]|uniref:Coiled-coil and C2 domain-containing protein 1B n=1 Tax=Frankliniella fusca TaxID=407009 RepID=A0AAE1LEG8_9NEOP|nr:Coiled-coil and C2 domain-containing protein 1B [Frankliniella fusca]